MTNLSIVPIERDSFTEQLHRAGFIERRDSAPRLSVEEMQWHAEQDAEYEAIQAKTRLLNDACVALRKLGPQCDNADIVQLLETLASSVSHLPQEREAIDIFSGELECIR